MKEVYIVGGGASLRGFDFNKLKNKDTIVVNKSIFYVPQPNYFITCDYSFIIKISNENMLKKFQNIDIPKIFVVQSHLNYLQEQQGRILDVRYNNFVYDLKDFNIIIKSCKAEGVGLKWNDFRNGINSGYCALQLAVLLGYNRIYLLGIDLQAQNQTHFHKGYDASKEKFEKNLKIYSKYFEIGLKELKRKHPKIKVYSCSKISELNSIIPYKEI